MSQVRDVYLYIEVQGLLKLLQSTNNVSIDSSFIINCSFPFHLCVFVFHKKIRIITTLNYLFMNMSTILKWS